MQGDVRVGAHVSHGSRKRFAEKRAKGTKQGLPALSVGVEIQNMQLNCQFTMRFAIGIFYCMAILIKLKI